MNWRSQCVGCQFLKLVVDWRVVGVEPKGVCLRPFDGCVKMGEAYGEARGEAQGDRTDECKAYD